MSILVAVHARLDAPQARGPTVQPGFSRAGSTLAVLFSIHLRLARGLLFALSLAGPSVSTAQSDPTTPASAASSAPVPLPSFAELEAQGAKIGAIRVVARDIFDLADPQENKLLFRWANALHIGTRPGVIEQALLFSSGEPVSVRLIEETERVLRTTRYLYEVHIRPAAVHNGVVDIDVETRDSWTLDPGASVSRSGGANSSAISLREYNLLGSGVAVSFGRSSTVDRSGNEFQISQDRAFGGWTSLSYSRATNSDGRREAVAIAHPFYSLDSRWAAGASASDDNRIDAVYNAGVVQSQFRHRLQRADVYGGLSNGLVDGWVQRWSLGVNRREDRYAVEPGLTAPAQLPADETLIGPYVRYELIEDRFRTLRNRNLIERPETFALGLATSLQIGRASQSWGSTGDAWLYDGSISRGFEPADQRTLVASARITGQYQQGSVQRQQLGARLQYYQPQGSHYLFYASAAADHLTHPGLTDELLLGGDSGLRGYPLRYQSGHNRALFTIEERAYSDLYVWRLFRVGGAAFADLGRAWGGDATNTVKPGWISSVGAGLRIFSVRAAFSNVIHLDIAFPNDPDVNVKKVQFLVKTKTSF